MKRSIDDYVYVSIFLTIVFLFIIYIIYRMLGQPPITQCLIYNKTGIYCPGCGCTRAFINMLQGNIIQSLKYNPTVIYSTIVIGIYMSSQSIGRIFGIKEERYIMKYKPIYIYIGIVILMGTCIIKNIIR